MMKIIFTVLAVFLIFLPAKAQIENIKLAGDSTVTIDYAYAGILAGSYFSQDSLNFGKSVNVRLGFQGTYRPTKWLSIVAREMYQTDDQKKVLSSSLFWARFKLKSVTLETGMLPTLATESRPLSVSADGQFEAWTENNIPGTSLGAKIKYNFQKSYIGAGVFQRNKEPEYHLRFSSPHFKASLYYSEFDHRFGSTATLITKRLYNIATFNAGKNFGNYAVFKLDRRRQIDYYLDAGYGFEEKKIIRAETGLLKNFSGRYLKGLFGLGYCYETKTINGIFFVHI
ncbi:MAG: hypothetical protein NTY31_00770 [Candidatus Falkowbacteria bacterium]|nr:hypothetical protein [Candidatus Falkowbacteria bacterium]